MAEATGVKERSECRGQLPSGILNAPLRRVIGAGEEGAAESRWPLKGHRAGVGGCGASGRWELLPKTPRFCTPD